MVLRVSIKKNEFWWGGAVNDGDKFPLSIDSVYASDFFVNETYNQLSGAFVSTMGRYLYTNGDYSVKVEDGTITVVGTAAIDFGDGYQDLQGAVKAVAKKHYTLEPIMCKQAVTQPQYCTWMEMLNRPTQEKWLCYAHEIVDAGLPAGVLILDDGWQKSFGDWRFCDAFPAPEKAIEKLHALGFTVVLWLAPFVDESVIAQWGEDALVHERSGAIAMRKWWNGTSAVLDMTSISAREGLKNRLDALTALGVDGFKFDGGDAMYYFADDVTAAPITPNEQSRTWAEFGLRYGYAELRACVGLEGRRLIERLCDKNVAWHGANGGLNVLIPDMIQAGLVGYPYVCPDMIGGGQSEDADKATDADWYIRSMQVAVLMPMWQFSRAIWRDPLVKAVALDCVQLREKVMPILLAAVDNAAVTGEPILRPLCYDFAGQGLERIIDSFTVGGEILVAPVLQPATSARQVTFPSGCDWVSLTDGVTYRGGTTATVACGNTLPAFRKK